MITLVPQRIKYRDHYHNNFDHTPIWSNNICLVCEGYEYKQDILETKSIIIKNIKLLTTLINKPPELFISKLFCIYDQKRTRNYITFYQECRNNVEKINTLFDNMNIFINESKEQQDISKEKNKSSDSDDDNPVKKLVGKKKPVDSDEELVNKKKYVDSDDDEPVNKKKPVGKNKYINSDDDEPVKNNPIDSKQSVQKEPIYSDDKPECKILIEPNKINENYISNSDEQIKELNIKIDKLKQNMNKMST